MTADPTPDLDAIRERLEGVLRPLLGLITWSADAGLRFAVNTTNIPASRVAKLLAAIEAAPTDIADLAAWGEGLAEENKRLWAANAEHVRMIRDLRKAMRGYDAALADERAETAAATGGTDD